MGMLTNNVDKLDIGTGRYTFLLNERGGIIDDLIVYRIEDADYLLVVNAARADEDFAWLQNHLKGLLPNKSQHGFWCSGHSRATDHGVVPSTLW